MPYNMSVREAYPPVLEQAPIVGKYVQGGNAPVDYYNTTGKSIMPGEPILIFGRLMISKSVILPGEFGSVVDDCVVDYLVDPALGSNILQDDVVYFDTDKGSSATLTPGYVTKTQPTNGYKLGHAIARHQQPANVWKNGSSVPIAAGPASGGRPASVRVLVRLWPGTPTTYGTVQDWNS